jgi:hypothetical protein
VNDARGGRAITSVHVCESVVCHVTVDALSSALTAASALLSTVLAAVFAFVAEVHPPVAAPKPRVT